MYKKLLLFNLFFIFSTFTNEVKAQSVTNLSEFLAIDYSAGTEQSPINVELQNDLIITSDDTSNFIPITGSYVNIDGGNYTITISGITGYAGLLQNAEPLINDNITVSNLTINVVTSTLAMGGGWIAQTNFSNAVIDNCSSNGPIAGSSGGIVGNYTKNTTVKNSFFTGSHAANGSGGIIGASSQNSSVINCYSLAPTLTTASGGIFGRGADGCSVENSYSISTIYDRSGGIFGVSSKSSSVSNCYFIGTGISQVYGSSSSSSSANTTTNTGYSTSNWVDSDADTYLLGATDDSIWYDTDTGATSVPYSLVETYTFASNSWSPSNPNSDSLAKDIIIVNSFITFVIYRT